MKNILNIFLLMVLLPLSPRAQCPAFVNIPNGPQNVCDLTPNFDYLWNETYWLDPLTLLHDMGEGPVELNVAATDVCTGTLTLRCFLFLDLDHDGVQETVINSDSLGAYAPGMVPFGNGANPNYSGGTPRRFDGRPLPADQQYRFALEVSGDGTNQTARLRWNTLSAPGMYVNPELPYGAHKIRWIAANNAGDADTSEYLFTVRDCKKPTVVCLNGLSVNLMPTQMITLWASDFLQYTEDNHTPNDQLVLGIRKSGAGTGFPVDSLGAPQVSVTYDCDELGTKIVELWAKDRSGNADYCETYVIVQDNMGVCQWNGTVQLGVCVNHWCTGGPVSGWNFDVQISAPGLPPFIVPDTFAVDANGCRQASPLNGVPLLANYAIIPTKNDDPLNGVDVFDLMRISQHILGIQPLSMPYGGIAADVNKSYSITSFDIVETRKLLLGIYQEFPSNTSWRFVYKDFVFPNPANPFQLPFPETIELTGITDSTIQDLNFVAIKTGDVDCTAIPGFSGAPEVRSQAALLLPDRRLRAGEILDLPVFPAEAGEWMGLQFGLKFDPELVSVEAILSGSLPGWDDNASAQPRPGLVNAVWFDAVPRPAWPAQPLFYFRLKALADVQTGKLFRLSETPLPAKVYTGDAEPRELKLQFLPVPDIDEWIGEPAPNPTAAGAILPLQAQENTAVQVAVWDLRGRLCWQWKTYAGTDLQQVNIPAEAFPAPGLYVWRALAGNREKSGKIARQ